MGPIDVSLDINPIPFGKFLKMELPLLKDWVADGILPRQGVMMLAGSSKVGKSFFCLELCRSLALGEAPFDHPKLSVPEPARVLYVEDEVKKQGLQKRGKVIFDGINGDLLDDKFFVVSGVPELRFDNSKGFALLERAIEKVQPNVLILDPIGRLIGGLDENRNDEMGKVLGRLDQILARYEKTEMSLVMAHHSRKPSNDRENKSDPLSPHSMRGASRFFANPDTIVMVDRFETYKNPAGHKAWKVMSSFETRQSEGLDNTIFTVNDMNDLRVRYYRKMEEKPPKLEEKKVSRAPLPAIAQLRFTEG